MPQVPGDPLDFPCSYTFRAYSAEINEGIDLPHLIPRNLPQPDPEPFDLETIKDAVRQVLAEKHFRQLVTRERVKLLEESKAVAKRTAKERVGRMASEARAEKHQKPIYEEPDGIDHLL